jgi:hypothetical protein
MDLANPAMEPLAQAFRVNSRSGAAKKKEYGATFGRRQSNIHDNLPKEPKERYAGKPSLIGYNKASCHLHLQAAIACTSNQQGGAGPKD